MLTRRNQHRPLIHSVDRPAKMEGQPPLVSTGPPLIPACLLLSILRHASGSFGLRRAARLVGAAKEQFISLVSTSAPTLQVQCSLQRAAHSSPTPSGLIHFPRSLLPTYTFTRPEGRLFPSLLFLSNPADQDIQWNFYSLTLSLPSSSWPLLYPHSSVLPPSSPVDSASITLSRPRRPHPKPNFNLKRIKNENYLLAGPNSSTALTP